MYYEACHLSSQMKQRDFPSGLEKKLNAKPRWCQWNKSNRMTSDYSSASVHILGLSNVLLENTGKYPTCKTHCHIWNSPEDQQEQTFRQHFGLPKEERGRKENRAICVEVLVSAKTPLEIWAIVIYRALQVWAGTLQQLWSKVSQGALVLAALWGPLDLVLGNGWLVEFKGSL